MSERAEGVEPFPVTADPQSYVETAATEEVLEALERRVREGRAPVVLLGAPGVGKTLLLRVLEQRLVPSFRVAYLPMAVLPAEELCAWVLDLLDESPGEDPERDLLAAGLRLTETGSPLVVLLDDAGSMPVATARRLSALLARGEGAVRLVMALPESARSDQVLASFQPGAIRVELPALMSADETARYLRAHLVSSNASPEVRARFDPISIRYLHHGSGGIPRVLSGLAGEVARGNLAVLPLQETADRDETLGVIGDPFEVTSDPAAYVPRPATQELLESVEGALGRGARAIAVAGPPGLGKTMLLRVLERRLRAGFQPVRISYTALLPDEFCRWILTLADEPVAEDPEAALRELAVRLAASGTNLVLLLDDAGAIPIPTVRHLADLSSETNGAMRLVLFAVEDARTASILEALGSDAVALRFRERMSEEETAWYLETRLAHARAPTALVEHFDAETVARLHAESDGIPREVHKLASELYGEAAIAVATRASARDLAEARSEPPPLPPPAPPAPVEVEDPAPEPAPAPVVPSRAVAEEPVPEPAPAPAVSPRAAVEKPVPEPAPPRAGPSRQLVALGLLGIAILLGVTLLFRGGFPRTAGTPSAGPTEAPHAAPASPETSPPVGSAETIAVNVNATPWASVEVDGEYLGVTPLSDILLSPGLHVFRARMPDGDIREHRVEVGPTMRHVVFYAELPKEVEPEPEIASTATSHSAQEPPAIPVEHSKPAEEPPPEIAAEPLESPQEETAEPSVAPAPPSPLPEEVPEIAASPLAPPQEEAPEPAAPPEQLASARPPEPAPPLPPPEPISVSINATPWATIEIDGEEIGVTPMANVPLAPGDRQFRVIMPDGTVLEQVVRIAPDNRHIAFP